MFRTDFEIDTMPFIIEGEHTKVFGAGEVLGKTAVALEPRDLLRNRKFGEPGVIPVLLDELTVSDDAGLFKDITDRLAAGFWNGFVTFGSSEMIRSHRRDGMPSHFILTLGGFADAEGFISVIDNDEINDLAGNFGKAMLRSEIAMYEGVDSILKAISTSKATIEFNLS